jgi:uncharacterized membrane protein YhaH (DUF805 family)
MNYYIGCLQKYAEFQGRARRKEYWFFVLFNFIFAVAASIIDNITGIGLLYTIYVLATLIPAIAAGVRRMHDVGKSGWFILIPIYNLVLALTEGDRGDNQYGPDPKAAGPLA